jgi:hypothetical protein
MRPSQKRKGAESGTRIGVYKPGNGEEGGFVPGEEVTSVEDDLRELEQEEGDVGGAGKLGRHGVPLLVLLRVLRANPSHSNQSRAIRGQCQERIERGANVP